MARISGDHRTIINLRVADDVLPEEESAVRAQGMAYKNVPFGSMSRPTIEQVESVLALIELATPPVLIHCERGADRTGTIAACYRIRHEGWTAERALDEASQNGMAWAQFGMKAFVRDFARNEKDRKNGAPIRKSSTRRRAPQSKFVRTERSDHLRSSTAFLAGPQFLRNLFLACTPARHIYLSS